MTRRLDQISCQVPFKYYVFLWIIIQKYSFSIYHCHSFAYFVRAYSCSCIIILLSRYQLERFTMKSLDCRITYFQSFLLIILFKVSDENKMYIICECKQMTDIRCVLMEKEWTDIYPDLITILLLGMYKSYVVYVPIIYIWRYWIFKITSHEIFCK